MPSHTCIKNSGYGCMAVVLVEKGLQILVTACALKAKVALKPKCLPMTAVIKSSLVSCGDLYMLIL